jgi:hypothetical protein
MKAEDIADDDFMDAVRLLDRGIGASAQDVTTYFGVPEKVVRAKAYQLGKRGLLTPACQPSCDCRGDWTVRE